MAFVELVALPNVTAHLVGGALESEGVRVRLERHPLAAVYGVQSSVFCTRVLVAEEDLDLARALLAEMEAAEPT